MGQANGNAVAAAYFNPRRVYTLERVHYADFGACGLKMSWQHLFGGRTTEAYVVWVKRTAIANWRRACGEETAHLVKSSPTRYPF